MNRYRVYAVVYSSLILGLGSLMLFLAFLYLGSFTIINLGLEPIWTLVLDAGLSLLFFVQHSVMIRRGIQERLSKHVPDVYYSAFYAIASGTALLAVMVFWQKTSVVIADANGIYRIILRALFFLPIAGFAWGNSSLRAFDPFGVNKIRRHIHNKETRPMPLAIRGAYRWLRHPLYFFSLVMIWSCPDLTSDRLLFNSMWSAWIVFATILEERDLVLDFGDQYREYQAKVPMIIPYKLPGRG
jgi:protein-S-isoprenylcysteine O-methyltransferase Ste14